MTKVFIRGLGYVNEADVPVAPEVPGRNGLIWGVVDHMPNPDGGYYGETVCVDIFDQGVYHGRYTWQVHELSDPAYVFDYEPTPLHPNLVAA